MNNQFSEDFKLLKKIKKDGDLKSRELLWNKYQRLVHKSFNNSREFYISMGIEREDFVQESYLQFESALTHFNLEKISTPETYYFYGYFWTYLRLIKTRLYRRFTKGGSTIYLDDLQDEKGGEFEVRDSSDFQSELEKENSRTIVRGYIGTLEPDDREVLELYISDKKISEISRIVSRPYLDVYRSIQKAKKQLETIYRETALA